MESKQRKKLVVLTGAGMSAESGISTFRDADGLWEQYRVEDVATHDALCRNPQLVTSFANDRREQCAACVPNQGHLLLAELERKYDVVIITQNIDDLHERAGSTQVIHLHGELMKCCTLADPDIPLPLPGGALRWEWGTRTETGEMIRPFIVYFGEAVPRMGDAIRACADADIFLIIGTSLNVYPAAGLADVVPQGIPKYVIDPHPVSTGSDFRHLQMGASEGMRTIVSTLE